MIEDEACIVEGVSALLSADGMEVHAVGLGAEGEAAVTSFAPDVVLLDFGLPDMDGAEVYARIRKLDPLLPVIFATGHADCRFILDGQSDSRTRFLRKPFEMTALLEIIEELQSPESQ
ncbi:MAG: response regulator, partial [Thermoanaerobaculia bacterium]